MIFTAHQGIAARQDINGMLTNKCVKNKQNVSLIRALMNRSHGIGSFLSIASLNLQSLHVVITD
jgi:hypothetical protein